MAKNPKKISYPEFDYLAERHPDFFERFSSIAKYPLEESTYLEYKVKLLIPMVILAYRENVRAVTTHIKRALASGLTVNEILEAFLMTLLPGGAPTLLCGLSALMKAEQELSQVRE